MLDIATLTSNFFNGIGNVLMFIRQPINDSLNVFLNQMGIDFDLFIPFLGEMTPILLLTTYLGAFLIFCFILHLAHLVNVISE